MSNYDTTQTERAYISLDCGDLWCISLKDRLAIWRQLAFRVSLIVATNG